jgi:hypothetical protein
MDVFQRRRKGVRLSEKPGAKAGIFHPGFASGQIPAHGRRHKHLFPLRLESVGAHSETDVHRQALYRKLRNDQKLRGQNYRKLRSAGMNRT